MKYFLSIACALFLIGCGNSADTTASTTPTEPATATTTVPEANPQPATVTEEPAAPAAAVEAPAPAPSPVTTPAAPAAQAPSTDAAALFGQKCVSCHGAKGEKAALGKSQIINTLNEQQIKDALTGYQAGTYGREMKAVMQGQAKALNAAQIDALAKYIPTL